MANDLPTNYTDGEEIHGVDVNTWTSAINGKATFLGRIASQSAMVALSTADVGDFCYRTDVPAMYTLTALPASTAANWVQPQGLIDGGSAASSAMTIQTRRDTVANWISTDPVPAAGEIVFLTDAEDFKIGDGSRNLSKIPGWKNRHTLGASFRPLEGVTSAIGSSIVSGTDATGVGSIIGWASAAGKYRFLGMIPGTSIGGTTWCQNNNNSGITSPAPVSSLASPITVEFWSNATAISIYFTAGNQPDVWAIVDDKRIQEDWQHVNFSTGAVTWKLTQSSAVWRKYRICLGFSWFQGIAVNAGASIVPTTPGFQLAVVGDSYISGGVLTNNAIVPGTPGTIAAGTLIGELEQITGLEIWRFAIAGTGYVSTVGYTGGNYGSTQRVEYFAGLPTQFHACLIFGSINDYLLSAPTVATAAQAAWTAWAAAHPEMAPLIVAGVQPNVAPPGAYAPSGTATVVNAALEAAATTHPNVGTFIDLLNNPWSFGTGYDGAPVGDGNRDVFISGDQTHPTHLGARAFGTALAQKISQVALQNTVGV